HVGELLGLVLGPRVAAGVGPERDPYALLVPLGKSLPGQLDHVLPDRRPRGRATLGHVVADVDRRAPVDAAADHQVEGLVVEAVAVLHGVDASPERRLDALLAHAVRGDLVAEAVGLVHDGLGLLVREVRPGVERAVLDEVAAVGVVLDPVRAVLDLFADRAARVVGAVDHLHALRYLQLPRVAEERVHAGGRERPRRDEEPG